MSSRSAVKVTAQFVKLQSYATPAYSATNFILSQLEQEKDSYWYKELGWEFLTSVVYGRIPGLILKNKLDTPLAENTKQTLVSAGIGLIESRLYHMLIKNKSKANSFEEKLKDPKVQQSLIAMVEKIDSIANKPEFKKILESQKTVDEGELDSSDEETMAYLQENFSSEKLQKIYNSSNEVLEKKLTSTGN